MSDQSHNANPTPALWGDALPAVFVLLWSTGFIGSKLGAPDSEPFTFLLYRFAIATCLMAIIALYTKARWPNTRIRILHAIVVGLLLHGFYLGGVFWAIDRGTSAGFSALIVSLQPIIVAIFSSLFMLQKPNAKQWLGLALGITGVSFVVWESLGGSGNEFWGIAACTLSLAGISVGTLYQRHFCLHEDLRTHQTIQLFSASILMCALSFSFETQTINWSLAFSFALFWQTCIMSIGTFSLLYMLIRRGAATQVSSLFL